MLRKERIPEIIEPLHECTGGAKKEVHCFYCEVMVSECQPQGWRG